MDVVFLLEGASEDLVYDCSRVTSCLSGGGFFFALASAGVFASFLFVDNFWHGFSYKAVKLYFAFLYFIY